MDNPLAAKENDKSDGKASPSAAAAKAGPQEQAPKCPRCDSPNTKFCYYNNYSLTQPRHFCKTCRRYWTKGGALRNVPIGGGCRKNKKVKSSSRLSGDSRDSSSSSELGGFKFFNGLAPAMDFQLGGLNFPKFTPPPAGILGHQFNSFGDSATSSASPSILNLDPPGNVGGNFLGFNYSNPYGSANIPEMAAMNVNSNLASSIESLSSINQDLHWKLQQQRLAVLFGENKQNDGVLERPQPQIPQPILFHNLEGSRSEMGGSRKSGETETATTATEWFFGNSYAAPPVATPTPTSSGGNGGNENNGNWSGVPGWSNDLHRYNTLP